MLQDKRPQNIELYRGDRITEGHDHHSLKRRLASGQDTLSLKNFPMVEAAPISRRPTRSKSIITKLKKIGKKSRIHSKLLEKWIRDIFLDMQN